jgi:hypothetical protein
VSVFTQCGVYAEIRRLTLFSEPTQRIWGEIAPFSKLPNQSSTSLSPLSLASLEHSSSSAKSNISSSGSICPYVTLPRTVLRFGHVL